ncbi:glycosyltransferase family 39 protein [Scytonema tolypothrichoides VB-61278_2]
MKKFWQIAPETNVFDTIKITANEAPQHVPLYFVLVRIWMQWFGTSLIAMRSFTVLTSFLVFFAIYWLCMELFKSPVVASISVALIAVSPIHIAHAQIARPRMLWILMFLLSSAAFLRAVEFNRKKDWLIYGVISVLNVYSFFFSNLVLIGHGVYLLIKEKFSLTHKIKKYLSTVIFVLVIYSPWILVLLTNSETAKIRTDWTNEPAAFTDLFCSWTKIICDIFIYWHDFFEKKFLLSEEAFVAVFGGIFVPLAIYAFYFLYKHAPKDTWLFIMCFTGVTALAIAIPDLTLGGRRSAIDRYILPCVLGVQIAIAYLLATKITKPSIPVHTKLWRIAFTVIISIGILSCAISSSTETWNGKENFVSQSSNIINEASRPLLISDAEVFAVAPLNYELASHVKVLLVSHPTKVVIPNEFSNVFLVYPSQELVSYLKQQQFKIEPAYQDLYLNTFVWKASFPTTLWKIER